MAKSKSLFLWGLFYSSLFSHIWFFIWLACHCSNLLVLLLGGPMACVCPVTPLKEQNPLFLVSKEWQFPKLTPYIIKHSDFVTANNISVIHIKHKVGPKSENSYQLHKLSWASRTDHRLRKNINPQGVSTSARWDDVAWRSKRLVGLLPERSKTNDWDVGEQYKWKKILGFSRVLFLPLYSSLSDSSITALISLEFGWI